MGVALLAYLLFGFVYLSYAYFFWCSAYDRDDRRILAIAVFATPVWPITVAVVLVIAVSDALITLWGDAFGKQ